LRTKLLGVCCFLLKTYLTYRDSEDSAILLSPPSHIETSEYVVTKCSISSEAMQLALAQWEPAFAKGAWANEEE
jgi:hypothetical protein